MICVWLAFVACDSGDIAEKHISVTGSGKTVKVTAHICGVTDWQGTQYHLAVAGFSSDAAYAVMQRSIAATTTEQDVSLVVSNVSDDIHSIEFTLTNSLRERILTLAEKNMEDYANYGPEDTIYFDLGDVDVSLLGCLQSAVFNKACIQCHGGNGRTAGGLSLLKGETYANLVDVPSQKKAGETRVVSGSAASSLLHKILNEGGENILHYNHTEVLSSQFKDNLASVKELLDAWMDGLRPQ